MDNFLLLTPILLNACNLVPSLKIKQGIYLLFLTCELRMLKTACSIVIFSGFKGLSIYTYNLLGKITP